MNKDILELNQFFGTETSRISSTLKAASNIPKKEELQTAKQHTLGSIVFGPGTYNPTNTPEVQGPIAILSPEQLEAIKKGSEAIRFDAGKTNWTLVPFDAVEEINKVLDFGAKKYAAHNWNLNGGFAWTRVLNSLLRHIFAFMRGEDNDPESGLSHMAHAGCNVLFLLHYINNKKNNKKVNDDRHIS